MKFINCWGYRKIYLKTLQNFVYFMSMHMVSEANKVIDK